MPHSRTFWACFFASGQSRAVPRALGCGCELAMTIIFVSPPDGRAGNVTVQQPHCERVGSSTGVLRCRWFPQRAANRHEKVLADLSRSLGLVEHQQCGPRKAVEPLGRIAESESALRSTR